MAGDVYMRVRGLAPLLPVFRAPVIRALAFLLLSPLVLPAPVRADSVSAPSYSEKWIYYPDHGVATERVSLTQTLLSAHNEERRRWHVPSLNWDERLAADAGAYARLLAQRGYLQHADMTGKAQPQGENLWMGTRDAFGYDQMMAGFLDERRNYLARAVPNISRTGNWQDTGHYSQIIWRTTTSVGCALASNKDFDFLVCRYSPAGNVWGMRADEGGPDRMADAARRNSGAHGRGGQRRIALLPE